MAGHNAPIRVVIADQQPNVRQALWLVCEQGLGLTVVAEAANSAELLTLLRATHPQLLILEWGLPGAAPNELITLLGTLTPAVVVGTGTHPDDKKAALDAGIRYFVYKGDPPANLLAILQAAVNTHSQAQ